MNLLYFGRINVLVVFFFLFGLNTWAVNTIVIAKSSEFSSKVRESQTIYDIQCDVDLQNQFVDIPDNCVLKFSSGMLKNGGITGNNTYIENPSNLVIFDNISIAEKAFQFINDYIYVDWFGGRTDADRIQSAITFACRNRNAIAFLSRVYEINHTVTVPLSNIVFKGSGSGGEYKDMGTKIVATSFFMSEYANNPLFYVIGEPPKKGQSLGVTSGRISGITFSTGRGQDVFQFYLSGAPSRPLYIDHCSFLNCGTAIRVLENGTSTALGFLYVENCTMVGNKWNIVAHGRHTLLGLYFCKNVAEQCDGNINLGYSENYTPKPYEKTALKQVDYAASANIVICDNLLEGTVDCIYINGGNCVVDIERNYFETSRRQFVVMSFSNPNSTVTFQNNYFADKDNVYLQLRNCKYRLQNNFDRAFLKTTGAFPVQ